MNKADAIHSSKDLAGKKICFLGGTEIETQIQGYLQRQKIKWLPLPFQEEGEMEAAFIRTTVPPSQPMCLNSRTKELLFEAWHRTSTSFRR